MLESMALPDEDHPTGTNLHNQDSEPVTENLFVLTVATLVTYSKAVHIGVLARYQMHFHPLGPNVEWHNGAIHTILHMHFQLLGPNAEWNNGTIPTILDTSQGKESYHPVDRNVWLPLKVLRMRRETTNTT